MSPTVTTGIPASTQWQRQPHGRRTGWLPTASGGSPESGRSRASIPLLSDADPASEGQTPQTSEGTGSIAAIDQMAGWARFGDTKATILAAGLGVAATMFNSSAPAVFKAMSRPCPAGLLVGGFALLTVLSFMRNCQYLWIGVFQATSVPAC